MHEPNRGGGGRGKVPSRTHSSGEVTSAALVMPPPAVSKATRRRGHSAREGATSQLVVVGTMVNSRDVNLTLVNLYKELQAVHPTNSGARGPPVLYTAMAGSHWRRDT